MPIPSLQHLCGPSRRKTPRYPPICTTSPEFFGSNRGLFRYSARPTKGVHAPTGAGASGSDSDPANNAHLSESPNTARNFSPRQAQIFAPIPMTYGELLSSLIANQLVVVVPRKIFQSPFPKWYNPSVTCAYHGGTPGHSIE